MYRAIVSLGLRLVLLLALLTLPYAPLAQPVAATPSFVGFVVNSAADSNIADSILTLREAIGVANGTLTTGFTSQEQAQLGGCTFDGGGNITGGCGAGTPEEIRFDANYTITLGSPLPSLSDNGTIIATAFGYGTNVQINANNISGNAFKITGNDVKLDGLRMYGAGTGFSNVWITGSAKRVVIANNYIGDDDGNSPCNDANAYGGIYVDAAGPLVGGDARAWIYGNVIDCHSGSPGDGITLVGTDNVVIGADALGNATNAQANVLGSNQAGIVIRSGAHDNFVRNTTISSSARQGVLIRDSSTATNTVNNNFIGYNTLDGIILQNGTHANRAENNEVSHNQLSGIYLASGATGNLIGANQIDHNQKYGVVLDGSGTTFNLITRTLIFNNTLDGIGERNSASLNVWEQVRIQDNGGLGIDKNAASEATNTVDGPFPVIRSVDATTGIVTGTASNIALVELYRVAPDPSGYGEGMSFVASTVSNGAGNWTINLGAGNGGCFTAFQTIGFIFYTSSEFGPNSCRTFLPLIQRSP